MLDYLGKGYCNLSRGLNLLQSPLLLMIRIIWGAQFIFAGLGKFADIPHTASYFASLGIPWPEFNAYLVATVESCGGLLLLLGLIARVAVIPLIINMVVALFTAHIDATKNLFNNFSTFLSQPPILFLYTCLVVLAFGPGRFSLDYFFRKKHEK